MELSWTPEVPDHVSSLVPYPPGKPIEETEREFGITGVVKLASNENPLGASPKALEALRRHESETHIYPDGSHFNLKRALAARLACSPDEIVVGCGSNEFIDLLPRVFAPRGRNIVTHQAAFVIYKLCAQLVGCGCKEAPVDDAMDVSVDALLAQVDENTRLVMLANPNNPTGNWLDADRVEHLARELDRRRVLLVLDYAYWEYVTEKAIPDPMAVLRKFRNVVVLRTFSKAYGLAGLRVGYMVADAKIASLVNRARQPFNVTSAALVAALAALEDEAHVKRSIELNNSSKAAIQRELASLGLKVYPSQGNFLLVDFGRPSKDLHTEFLKRGVIIRPVANYGFPTRMRVSAGLESENLKLFKAAREIFGGGTGR